MLSRRGERQRARGDGVKPRQAGVAELRLHGTELISRFSRSAQHRPLHYHTDHYESAEQDHRTALRDDNPVSDEVRSFH